MPNLTRGLLFLAIASLVCTWSDGLMAAPASSDEITNSNAQRGTADTSSEASTREGTNPIQMPVPQSKDVDLVLKLQEHSATVQRDAAQKSLTLQPERAASSAVPLDALKAAVLNSPLAKLATEGQDAAPSQTVQRDIDRSTTDLSGVQKQDSRSQESTHRILNNPVIRFIRENRMLTAGISLSVLIAVWVMATYSMRRSR